MSSRNAVERLSAMSQDPAPPMDPAAVDRLEQRLGRLHLDTGPITPVTTRDDGSRVARRRLALVAVAAAAVLFVAAMPLMGDDGPELLAADGVVLSMPDGARRTAAVGDRLPDGTEIRVADDGFAVIDGVRVPGGTIARVVGGRLVVVPEPSPAPAGRPGIPPWFPFPTTTNTTVAGADDEVDRLPPPPDRERPSSSPTEPVTPTTSTTTTAPVRPSGDETRPAPTDGPASPTERTTTTTAPPPPTRPTETTTSAPTRSDTRTR